MRKDRSGFSAGTNVVICHIATIRDWSNLSPFASPTPCPPPALASGNICLLSKMSVKSGRSWKNILTAALGNAVFATRESLNSSKMRCYIFMKKRYELLAWCVLPNHVHVLVHVWQTPLGKLVQSWKRFVATRAEALLTKCHSSTRRDDDAGRNVARRRAVFQRQTLQWQREYWDTFMRDREQDRKAIRYIEGNPVKSKLCRTPAGWPFGSARFREPRTQTLVLPAHASSAARK
jgi:REP element-mobilizing transposase RayT